jgi:colanic acid/amylovoran biosynthesis glycosyltransferase
MRIAYLINQYPWVSHSFIRREICALEAMGLEVCRFSIRDTGGAHADAADCHEARRTRVLLNRPWALAAAVTRALLGRPVRFGRALRLAWKLGRCSEAGIVRSMAYLAEACRLRQWLHSSGCRHLHAHFGTNPAAVAMLCQELGGPAYSFTVHGPDEFDRAPHLALDEKIARARFVAAISEFGRSQLMRWCDARHWSKLHIVRCGLDDQFLDHERVPIPAAPRLVCVGRLCAAKGQLLLVEAAQRLAREGVDFRLVLVGDGELRGRIESLVAQQHLGDRITITGWASNQTVRAEVLGARAMVLPSFAEGLPVVIMEALALGRPVISTYIAGIPELVKPAMNGWLIPAGSVEGLAAAMREALTMPVERLEQMGRHGARTVAQRHDVAVEARRLAQLVAGTADTAPMRLVPEMAAS